MRVEILQPCHAIGQHGVVPSSFSNDADAANPVIAELWEAVLSELDRGADDSDLLRFAITTPVDDQTPPLRIHYTAAVVTSGDVRCAQRLEVFDIEGGRYAVFPYEGTLDGLDEFYRRTYLEEFNALSFTARDGQHLEKLLSPPLAGLIAIEAWIPIAP